jgi:hypothetical protein
MKRSDQIFNHDRYISKNPMGCLGTIEGQAARVRFMDTFRADENGLIFYTGKKSLFFNRYTDFKNFSRD